MPKGCVAHQGLAGDLEEDPAVCRGYRRARRSLPGFLRRHQLARLGRDFGGEVVLALLDPLAQLEADEAAHLDVLADLADLLGDHLGDRHVGVLDERLLEQHELGVVLLHLAGTIFSTTLAGLPEASAWSWKMARSRSSTSAVTSSRRTNGLGRRDVHRDVAHQLLELVGAGHEVGLAVDLDQDADLAAAVDVGADRAFGRDPAGLLGRRGEALLAQRVDRLSMLPCALVEGVLAVHHSGAGALPELLDHLSGDFSHDSVLLRTAMKRMFGFDIGCG